MTNDNPFVGTIDLVEEGNEALPILKYSQIPKNDLSLDQTFIHCFKNLGLSPEEKQALSVKDRNVIHHYQQFSVEMLLKLANQLVKAIEKISQHSDLCIQAEHLGAFICLAAIYSGKLPENKHVTFNLGNAPFKIFPSKLMSCNLPDSGRYSISFYVDKSCWLSSLFSLYQSPKGLEGYCLEKKSA